MKKLLFPLVILVAFSIFFTSCDSPLKYHDKIIENYNSLDSIIVVFVQDVYDKEASVADLQQDYDETLKMCEANMADLAEFEEMADDPGFYSAVVEFHEVCRDLLDNEFKSIIDIYLSGDWTDEKGAQVDGLMEQIYNNVVEMEDKVVEFEELFAQKHDITLLDVE
ncbi:MAG: hypothetical protein U9Q83_04940 [Bacteroidota bacterium]|nr:hypothetical protein [Bacteroidota bacterium]